MEMRRTFGDELRDVLPCIRYSYRKIFTRKAASNMHDSFVINITIKLMSLSMNNIMQQCVRIFSYYLLIRFCNKYISRNIEWGNNISLYSMTQRLLTKAGTEHVMHCIVVECNALYCGGV